MEIASQFNEQLEGPKTEAGRNDIISNYEIQELENRRAFIEKMKTPAPEVKAPQKSQSELEVEEEVRKEMERLAMQRK